MASKINFRIWLSWLLCGAAAVMLLGIAAELATMTGLSGLAGSQARAQKAADPNAATKNIDPRQALRDKIRDNNRFVPKPPEPQPPGQVLGILADQALFPNSQWAKVGDAIEAGAKVISISATEVVIEWKGEKRTLYPIKAAIALPVAPPPPAQPQGEKKAEAGGDNPAPSAETTARRSRRNNQPDELDWLDIPPHLKDFVRTEWNKLNEEQKAEARKMYENAPPEAKEQMLQELEREVSRKNQ